MKRPPLMVLRWVAKCHLESFLTFGVEKRTFGSTPQPRVQSWQMKVLFLGCPGGPKMKCPLGGDYSWEARTTQEMLTEPIPFLTAFHLTKRSLALSFFITSYDDPVKMYFTSDPLTCHYFTTQMNLHHHFLHG